MLGTYRLLAAGVVLASGFVHASGFYLGDNGAKAMVQGGAFTAQADDATAMQHNPAGLAQQSGLGFLVDVNILRHDVTYLRQDTGFDAANPDSRLVNTVSNKPDPFLLPFFGVTYGFPLAGRNATVGLGLFAPPSQGRYNYPEPNYAKSGTDYVENPRRGSPQRYALISNDIVIAYPTLSLAYDIHPRFQVGISAQLTLSRFQQTQSLYGGDVLCSDDGTCLQAVANPQRMKDEDPSYDTRVSIDLPGQVGFTGILGVMARPTDWLSFGASVRPPIPFRATGKMTVELPERFSSIGAQVIGDQATLTMTMPLEVKVGARVTPIAGLGINLDFVYLGWQSIDALRIQPENVSIEAPGIPTINIGSFAIRKDWMASYSGRVGASYRVFQYLSVHAGAMYETGAASTKTYSVDWTHPSRIIVTGGVTGHLGPMELIAGALFTPTVTTVVEDSQVLRGQTKPAVVPGTVGNGVYTSGAWGLIFGVRGRFWEAKPAAKPIEEQPRKDVTTI